MASLPPCMAMVGGSGKEDEVDDSSGLVVGSVVDDGCCWGGNLDEYQDDNGKEDGGANDKNGL